MARIKFKVKSIAGKALANVGIVINLKNHGLVEKTTDENGETSISGVEVGSTPVSVSKEGFEGQSFSVEVNSEDQTVAKERSKSRRSSNTCCFRCCKRSS